MSVTYYTREEFLGAQSRGFRLGQEDERERIIALLNDLKPSCGCNDCQGEVKKAGVYLESIIALIKGEQK